MVGVYTVDPGNGSAHLSATGGGGGATNECGGTTIGMKTFPPHTYSSPGTYTAKLLKDGVVVATLPITVTGTVGSVENSSQLAAALTALESLLKQMLELLK
jgi:hypothetical protein